MICVPSTKFNVLCRTGNHTKLPIDRDSIRRLLYMFIVKVHNVLRQVHMIRR